MMVTEYKVLEKEVTNWLRDLEKYNQDPLWAKYDKNEWSIGQMYAYLIQWGSKDFINGIKTCDSSHTKGKTLKGRMTFFSGELKAKDKLFTKVSSERQSIVELKDGLIRLLKTIDELPDHEHKGKSEHSVYGYLTHKEWVKLAVIYFKTLSKKKEAVNKHLM